MTILKLNESVQRYIYRLQVASYTIRVLSLIYAPFYPVSEKSGNNFFESPIFFSLTERLRQIVSMGDNIQTKQLK